MKKKVDISKDFLEDKRPFVVIGLLSFAVYLRSLFFGFTYFDDNVLILDNLFFLRNFSNFFRSFTMEVFHVLHASAAYYRPMLTISYMIDAQFSGANPFFYHLTSILIHVVVSCLVFVFLKKLKVKESLAFIFALIFSVHPVLTQAVSWIPGRNDSLLALFVLPAFIYALNYFNKDGLKNYFFHLIFFAFCVFTKESAVLIPLLILLLGTGNVKRDRWVKVFSPLIMGWFFVGLVWFYLRSIALSGNPLEYGPENIVKSVFENFPAVLLYLGKVFIPVNLSVLPILSDSTLLYGYISVVILIPLFIFSKKRNYFILVFGTSWFFAFLIPAFIRPNTSYVADFLEHRVYVPMIGLFVILSSFSIFDKVDLKQKAPKYIVILVIFILSLINIVHNEKSKDRLTFWKDAARTTPSHPLAHKNLGAMYYLDGDFKNAKLEFEKAVAINPTEPMIHNNLGLVNFREGEFKTAESEYFKELELYPSYDNAFMNLGLLYYQEGDKKKAEQMWLKTTEINPDHKEALKALAVYYATDAKDNQKAQYYYQEAVKRGAQF